jgi:hypothetical protein
VPEGATPRFRPVVAETKIFVFRPAPVLRICSPVVAEAATFRV